MAINIYVITQRHQPMSNFHLRTVKNIRKNWLCGLAASTVNRCKEDKAVKLLARVEQEIDKVDGDDNDERLGLFDSDKKFNNKIYSTE